ncbi:hypothetical protein PCG10_007106 [Penicillium crustosum]|uniref:GPI anchored serine-rich protein n=1 Tax=Penicillium crustosum TaxID=36656 RepID=A0A9P5L3G8_PENCR|nr:uncharacterized protein N7487_004243 [Penicillium crustosum]KAF7529548.1 hypothetical protein PCG10_007106 [Penicillium crustosum]KAJ5409884.1 hypothetical protein N7487_004243 [Penicillium crustosum]
MRFTTATIAFFAGLAIAAPGADKTVYETDEVTITSCAPTVTDCPGNKGGAGVEPTGSTTPSSAPAVATTPAGEAPETETVPVSTETPAWSSETPAWSSVPTWAPSVPAPSAPSSAPAPSAPAPSAPSAPAPVVSSSVIAITTCVPTVIYSTVPVSASTPAGSAIPHGPTGGVPHVPSSSKGVATGTAGVSPATSSPVFNGAGALSGSLGFAGAAAVAAFFL